MSERRMRPTGTTVQRGSDVPKTVCIAIEGHAQSGLLTVQPLIVGEGFLLLSAFKEQGLHDPLHRHDDHESISYQLSGSQRGVIGGEEFISEPGDAWYHAPGIPHSSDTLADSVQLEIKSPPMNTWSGGPQGPFVPGDWERAADPDGRRLPGAGVKFVKGGAARTLRVSSVEGAHPEGVLEITPTIVGHNVVLFPAFKGKGLIDPLHQHDDHETLGYCISGKLRLVIGGVESIAGPGDAWYHGRGVPHLSEALEDTAYVAAKTPPMKTWVSA